MRHCTTALSRVASVSASCRVWPRATAPLWCSASAVISDSYHASSCSNPRSGHRYGSPSCPEAGATVGSAWDSACRTASSTSSKKSSAGKPSGMMICTVWSRTGSASLSSSHAIRSSSSAPSTSISTFSSSHRSMAVSGFWPASTSIRAASSTSRPPGHPRTVARPPSHTTLSHELPPAAIALILPLTHSSIARIAARACRGGASALSLHSATRMAATAGEKDGSESTL
mmetsp:Transcript_5095/g.11935  ORF Transcript_5095/g.11935 Transcript_5095/m.11935 type:complete len:229 (-) Transcript_5095:970-1656(-)